MLALRAVAAREAAEAVTLHDPGEALALGDTDDVDQVARCEDVGADLLARREPRGVVHAHLDDVPRGLGVVCGEVALHRLLDGALADITVRELDGRVAVALGRLDLRDEARAGPDPPGRGGPRG